MKKYCIYCGKKLEKSEQCTCDHGTIKESFYIKDFKDHFFVKRNVPIIIYLISNMIFIYLVSVVVLPMFPELMEKPLSQEQKITFAIILLLLITTIYIVGIIISLSDIGEFILRQTNKCEPITDPEVSARLEPLFFEVYNKAKKIDPTISDGIILFIQDDENENAFAIGRKSMCVTKGLLNRSDEEIKGILAHEFGHLANKDTDVNLVVNVANWLINMAFFEIWAFIFAFKLVMQLVSFAMSLVMGNVGSAMMKIADMIYTALSFVAVKWFQKIWLAVGNMLILKTSQNCEFDADKFSVNSGYSDGLLKFFYTLDDAKDITSNKTLLSNIAAFATISSTHPKTGDRIKHVKELQGTAIAFEISELSESFTVISEEI